MSCVFVVLTWAAFLSQVTGLSSATSAASHSPRRETCCDTSNCTPARSPSNAPSAATPAGAVTPSPVTCALTPVPTPFFYFQFSLPSSRLRSRFRSFSLLVLSLCSRPKPPCLFPLCTFVLFFFCPRESFNIQLSKNINITVSLHESPMTRFPVKLHLSSADTHTHNETLPDTYITTTM